MPAQLGQKEAEIMDFLHTRIFDPILQSPQASEKLKQGVRYTIMRMEQRDAEGMIQYLRNVTRLPVRQFRLVRALLEALAIFLAARLLSRSG